MIAPPFWFVNNFVLDKVLYAYAIGKFAELKNSFAFLKKLFSFSVHFYGNSFHNKQYNGSRKDKKNW